ncbi:MAG: AAA family ATPase, partial [Pseudomonadales bacterium]
MDIELDPEKDDLDYWRAYDLECDPFAEDGIDGLYFPGGDRGELLQTALHIAQFSRQPVVFYGAEGIGKTSLLNAVASSMDNETLVLKLQAGFMTTREQIFAEIAHALTMSDVNYIPAAFRQQIVTALTQSEKPKTSVLLLVDDAHELIDKTLNALRELADEDSSDVRVLFFATTDGNGFLRPELDRSDIQQLAIGPLDQPGIEAYLKYRLGTAGFDGEFPFNDSDLESILNQSLGIPARIGRISEQKLRHKTRIASLKSKEASERRRLPWLHTLLIAILIALILLFVFWDGDKKTDSQPNPPASTKDKAAVEDGLLSDTVDPEEDSIDQFVDP